MITDENADGLYDMARVYVEGARPVEEVQVLLLSAILSELRTLRAQFDQVSAGGTALLTEVTK